MADGFVRTQLIERRESIEQRLTAFSGASRFQRHHRTRWSEARVENQIVRPWPMTDEVHIAYSIDESCGKIREDLWLREEDRETFKRNVDIAGRKKNTSHARHWIIHTSPLDSFLACFFPLGAWLFGLLNHFSLLLSFICSTSIILSLYVSVLIGQQIYLVGKSQTWYEHTNNIRIYNHGKSFVSNLELVFGQRWYLALLYPLVPSPPAGDAMSFDTAPGHTGSINPKRTWMFWWTFW